LFIEFSVLWNRLPSISCRAYNPGMTDLLIDQSRRKKKEPESADALRCRVLMKDGLWLVGPEERPILREPPAESQKGSVSKTFWEER
jgi:hypothetical protein